MIKKDRLVVFKCSAELEMKIKKISEEKDVPISMLIRKIVEKCLPKINEIL